MKGSGQVDLDGNGKRVTDHYGDRERRLGEANSKEDSWGQRQASQQGIILTGSTGSSPKMATVATAETGPRDLPQPAKSGPQTLGPGTERLLCPGGSHLSAPSPTSVCSGGGGDAEAALGRPGIVLLRHLCL